VFPSCNADLIYEDDAGLLNIKGECPFDKHKGIDFFKGVKVNWDSDIDTRVLCFLDNLHPNIISQIISIGEHEACLDILIKNNGFGTTTYKIAVFLSEIGADGIENGYSCGVEVCGDYWTINIVIAQNYKEYILSEKWKEKSKAFNIKNNGACSLCGSFEGNALVTHHIKYPKDLKNDVDTNWIAVCRTCHNKLHGIKNKVLYTWD